MTDRIHDVAQSDLPDDDEHSVLAEAMRDVEKRRGAERASTHKAPEPAHKVIKRRTDNLRAALNVAKSQDYVTLPELSRRSPSGEPVRLRVRRLSIQELAASDLLPRRADTLVSKLVELGMKATESPRSAYGVESITRDDVNEVVEEVYGGWTRDALAAFFELQCAVCCAAVIDEDYRLYMDYEDVRADPERGVLVWEIPDEDLETIFAWVLTQEERAESTVMPFRGGRYADDAVQPEPESAVLAERPDSV